MCKRGNRWKDHYARRAREENWFARSVYKLQEIDLRFKIIGKGKRVLDLGCFPGSWSQYALRKVGPLGRVTGVDLRRPEGLRAPNFLFREADVLELGSQAFRAEVGEMDVVLSDLAPSTSGIRDADCARSMALAAKAFEIATALLSRGGQFVCKVFEGGDFQAFRCSVSSAFEQLRLLRPSATRKRSREVYVIGLGARTFRAEKGIVLGDQQF